jgi:hypothetical protein
MPNNSVSLDSARAVANTAFDHHCAQWEVLQGKAEPTPEDLDAWLEARDAFYKAQATFEEKIRKQFPA